MEMTSMIILSRSAPALNARKKGIRAGRASKVVPPGMNFGVGGAGIVEGTHEASKLVTQVDKFSSLLACLARRHASPKTAWMWMSTTIDVLHGSINTYHIYARD
jgi:hypothetical protein